MNWARANRFSERIFSNLKGVKGPTAKEMESIDYGPKPWNWQDPSRETSAPEQPQALDLTDLDLIRQSYRK